MLEIGGTSLTSTNDPLEFLKTTFQVRILQAAHHQALY